VDGVWAHAAWYARGNRRSGVAKIMMSLPDDHGMGKDRRLIHRQRNRRMWTFSSSPTARKLAIIDDPP
jgi:hypothetical protein